MTPSQFLNILSLHRMSKYCENEELQVFRKHFYDLTIAIQDPDTLAVRLYSEGFITESVRDHVLLHLPKQVKCTILVVAMETSLKVKPSNFTAFIVILQSDRTLWPIARLLTNKCKNDMSELFHSGQTYTCTCTYSVIGTQMLWYNYVRR